MFLCFYQLESYPGCFSVLGLVWSQEIFSRFTSKGQSLKWVWDPKPKGRWFSIDWQEKKIVGEQLLFLLHAWLKCTWGRHPRHHDAAHLAAPGSCAQSIASLLSKCVCVHLLLRWPHFAFGTITVSKIRNPGRKSTTHCAYLSEC